MKRIWIVLLGVLLFLSACAPGPVVYPQPDEETVVEPEGTVPMEPYQPPEPIYERYYEEYTDHLIPEKGYGNLYPFAGKVHEDGLWGDVITYGLMTASGEIVVDPVYQSVKRLRYYDQFTGEETVLPVLTMSPAAPDGNSAGETLFMVAAQDGSWVIEGTYVSCAAISKDAFILQDENGIYHTFDTSGKTLTGFIMHDPEGYFESWWNGTGVFCNHSAGQFSLVNALNVEFIALEGIDAVGWGFGGGLLPARGESGLWGYVNSSGEWVFQPALASATAFQHGFAEAVTQDGQRIVMDTAGKVFTTLTEDCYLTAAYLSSGEKIILQGAYEGEGFRVEAAYYEDWSVYEGLRSGDVVEIYNEGILQRLENGRLRWSGETHTFSLPDYADAMPVIVGDCLCVYGDGVSALLDRHGRELIEPGICGGFYTLLDEYTNETYILGTPPYGQNQVWYLCDREGNILLTLLNESNFENVDIREGMVQYRSGDLVNIMTLTGEMIFRYPLEFADD